MADEPDPEIAEVLEAVKAGDFDFHLGDLIEAVRLRFQFGTTRQKWRYTYRVDGEALEVREDDLTLAEARLVERLTGMDWEALSPGSSAAQCLAVHAACLHARHGRDLRFGREGPSGSAWEEAGTVTAAEAADNIGFYEVERAPKS